MVRLDADDARTLAALYDRHAAALYSLAMRIVGEPADAEAIVRGVFAAAWSEAGRHPGLHAPDVHWLLSTTRVRAIDQLRASGAVDEETSAAAGAAGNDAATGMRARDVATLHVPDPAQARVTGESGPEDAPHLRAAFRGLPPLERLAIELAYFEGLTISQIAAHLEQAPDAANARLRTGLQRLGGAAARRAGEPRHGLPATRDLAGLYALGALNAGERAAFDAHLEVHRESVDEVLALLPVVRRLAWTAPPHEPLAELRERVIETVTGAPLPDTDAGAETNAGAGTSGSPDPEEDAGAAETADDTGTAETVDDTGDAETADDTGAAETVGDTGATETVDAASAAEAVDDTGATETVDAASAAETVDAASAAERADTRDGARPGDIEIDVGPAAGASEADPPADAPARPLQVPAPPLQEPTPTEQKATTGMHDQTPTGQKKGGRRALLLLTAGSLVAAGGLGWLAASQAGLATALQENLDAANTQARIAELETAAARQSVDNLRGGAQVLAAADVQTLDLDGQPAAPDARGRLYWSAAEGGLFAATGLPPLPPGRAYQLWLIPEATPRSAALLSADAEGRAMAAVAAPEGATGLIPAAVTIEPAGGSATPGGDVYLLGRP